ncbi:hypothetical protein KO506_10375 [Polaribacter vadi]|uniref:hypothetical protein n=1 Tax=Polaribacter TaxID=52959 RepID=UPI001C088362|nr:MULTISPECIES: hypothetical protein [Polaribacter]MBU3011810.1 hypothetical protein [Polaribacter vadi]MDO6741623.1 hypothetical protein [Polaribacter sp. 1_MG-2023]
MAQKKIRKSIPKVAKVRAELQAEINSECPFCENTEVGHFQIHHIDENPANNNNGNLLLLCPNCHSRITKGDLSQIDVLKRKIELLNNPKKTNKKDSQNVSFNGTVGNAVVGNNNTVNLKNTKKTVKQKYPEGCIGFESVKSNYIGHLIERYNKYKEYEVGKGNVKYWIFGGQLKKKFKIAPTRTIYNLPSSRFDELKLYIQNRIRETKLGKIKGSTHKHYSTFEEYTEKFG